MACIEDNEQHDWFGVGIHQSWRCFRCGKRRRARRTQLPTRGKRQKFCTHKTEE